MKIYLAKIDAVHVPKNKLEEGIQKALKIVNRHYFLEEDLEERKQNIISLINHLNTNHRRCKPVEPKWWSPLYEEITGCKDWHLDVGGCVSFTLYSSRN